MTENNSTKIEKYIEKRAKISSTILSYLEGDEILENDFNIFKILDEIKTQEKDNNDLKNILTFLSIILNNHKPSPDFFNKTIEILFYLKDDIKKIFTNEKFYNFFSSNNKILYHLFEKNMIKLNKSIMDKIKKASKIDYLEPVVEMYYTNQPFNDYDEELREKRKSGENDNYISKLIRNDSVQEFIKYVNSNNYSLKSQIKKSVFETDPFLLERNPTLIEYSAFYGSIQIFRYLLQNNVELTPSLWLYTIHSKNAELIHILEEYNVEPEGRTYDNCIIEAIKCHHNDIANYLIEKANQKKMKYLATYLIYNNYEMISIDKDSYSNCNLQIEQLFYLYQNYFEFIHLLFEESYLNINYNDGKNTLFSYAFKNYNWKLINYLLSNPNIDPNNTISNEKNALMISIEREDMKLIKLLLACPNININFSFTQSAGKEKNYILEEMTALYIAIQKGNKEIIELLLQNQNINTNLYLNYNGKERTLLSDSIENNDIETVKLLLAHPNTDPNIILEQKFERRTALCIAIEKGNKQIVDILLSNEKINPNSKLYINGEQKTELLVAIEKGNKKIIETLVKNKKIDPCFVYSKKYKNERTVLSKAIEEDNFELTKLLLSSPNTNIYTKIDKEIKFQNEKKNVETILNLAIYKDNKDIICLLFEHKKRFHSK